jgi:cation diffusion facilitator CzcD-associated flavoprotein CzcO
LKNLLQVGCRSVVCYDESNSIGGNWAYSEDAGRISVYECSHIISSKRMSSFDDFPMPETYPDYPSHRQLLAYFSNYAKAFDLGPHIRLGSRVEQCTRAADGRWTVRVTSNGATSEEVFDWLLVCSGHHRLAFVPDYPGQFAGMITHSSAYKRPDTFRGQRVLVVGAGNSAADIAVDLSRVTSYAALSMREGTYFIPKLMFGQPVDVVYAFWKGIIPKRVFQAIFKLTLRMAIGRWEDYGLQAPVGAPLTKHPTGPSCISPMARMNPSMRSSWRPDSGRRFRS